MSQLDSLEHQDLQIQGPKLNIVDIFNETHSIMGRHP